MRANIIIHSISGNLYLIAKAFCEQFAAMGIDSRLYAVSDSDLHIEANERTEVNEYYEDIIALPEATNAKLEKADAIILATPSRFGMPTAEMKAFLAAHPAEGVWQGAFIDRMDYAYAIADVVISRSGACTVSELCAVGKPVLFVPSPNVAEDHQTKNAQALVRKKAAMMVGDSEAVDCGISTALRMLSDSQCLQSLSKNISRLARPNAADRVADEILKYSEKR